MFWIIIDSKLRTVLLQDTAETASKPLNIETMYSENNDTFSIFIKEIVSRNSTVLVDLKFVSQLTDTLQGFYRTQYETQGEQR